MALTVTRTMATVTVHVGCDRCHRLDTRDGLTAGAAIDSLESVGWHVDLSTSEATCADCGAGEP